MLVEAFRKADKNGDGRLSTAEIHGIYLDHGVEVTMEEVMSSFFKMYIDKWLGCFKTNELAWRNVCSSLGKFHT